MNIVLQALVLAASENNIFRIRLVDLATIVGKLQFSEAIGGEMNVITYYSPINLCDPCCTVPKIYYMSFEPLIFLDIYEDMCLYEYIPKMIYQG